MIHSELLYKSKDDWLKSKKKKITLVGMSGLGKTFLAKMLHDKYQWVHYSVDYMIGSMYMKDLIFQNGNVSKINNFSIKNLSALSEYLGNPGNKLQDGLDFQVYVKRQREHRNAEISAMLNMGRFIKANTLSDRMNFVCDSSGSLCEIVNPNNPNDKILSRIAEQTLIILIKETDQHMDKLKSRFKKAPKPMYYNENFLNRIWQNFCSEKNVLHSDVNPYEFSLYGFEKLISHRRPIYNMIAKNWGIEIPAADINHVKSEMDLNHLIADYLPLK